MHIFLIFISLISVYFSYHIGDVLLQYYYNRYNTLEYHRQRYVVKNFIKGIYLSIFTIYASMVVKWGMWNGVWYNNAIHTLGILYCLPDLMGLLKVPKLHRNTIFHHVTVCILSTINTFNDYENQDTIWKGMIIYAYISSLTGIVNHYLAYRLVCEDDQSSTYKKYMLAVGAYNIYASSLVINWIYQIYIIIRWIYKICITFFTQVDKQLPTITLLWNLWTNNKLGIIDFSRQLFGPSIDVMSHIMVPLTVLFVYIGLLYFIVVDDIVLVKFLKKEISKKNTQNVQNVQNIQNELSKNEDINKVIKTVLKNRGIPSSVIEQVIGLNDNNI